MSSGLRNNFRPVSFMFYHRIENRQQFSHASDECDLWSFAGIAQSAVKRLNHRITSAGDQGAHVKSRADGGSPTPDRAPASQCATVAIEGCYAHQRGDLLTVESSQFGELCKQRSANDGPIPGTLLSRSSFSRQMGL